MGLDTNHDTKERFMMFDNYPNQPTQQEMDHLYETHKVGHSILSVLEKSLWPVPNDRTYSHTYDVDYLRAESQTSNPASSMLKRDERQRRADVFGLNPSHMDEVEEVTAAAVVEMRIHFEAQSHDKPCLILNPKAFIDLTRSALGSHHMKDFNRFHNEGSNQILGCPVFRVESGEKSEIMMFDRHSIRYSDAVPTTFFEEAKFGGANIYKFGPHAVEIMRRITNLKVNTQVVLHSNFGLEPKKGSMIWKMVAKS